MGSFEPPVTVHVVGAGMAGLACAVALAGRGLRPVLHEAAAHAGGRCRSFADRSLGCVIDNGNHLMLSANRGVTAYLQAVGGGDGLHCPARAAFPFLDLATGEAWTLRPGAGRLPLWLLDPARRAPGTTVGDHLAAFRLRKAAGRSMAEVFDTARPAWRRFWEPLTVAVLNTAADEADAGLLWPVMAETFLRGEAACRPMIARHGLSEALVAPALVWLGGKGVEIGYGRRLRALRRDGGRVAALEFDGGVVELAAGDAVVLALPPWAVAELLPEVTVPDAHRPIVNVHFRLPAPVAAEPRFMGLVGGTAQWLFLRHDVASVTVSVATALVDQPNDDIAAAVWREVAFALRHPAFPHPDPLPRAEAGDPVPPFRVLKERRATFAQTPEQVRRRPGARTVFANLFLAGDWTDTGLPATIEGAVRSGQAAADLAARQPFTA